MNRQSFSVGTARFDAPDLGPPGMTVAGAAAWGGTSTLGWVEFVPMDLCLWFQDVPVLGVVFEDAVD